MSQIRCIYHEIAPDFPATDQHPSAERFFQRNGAIMTEAEWNDLARKGGKSKPDFVIDAIGTPTTQEISDILNPMPESKADRLLSRTGLTVDDIKGLVGIATATRVP